MNKKFTSILLTLAIIIQLAIPIAMIANKTQTEKNIAEKGKEYFFNVTISSIYKNKLYYYFSECDRIGSKGFYIIEDYKDGYSKFVYSEHFPINKEYVKMSSFIETESFYELSENVTNVFTYPDNPRGIESTARVKIYKGEMKVLEILVDGIPINEWCNNPNNISSND